MISKAPGKKALKSNDSHSVTVLQCFLEVWGNSQLIIHQNFFGRKKMKDPEPMKIRGMESATLKVIEVGLPLTQHTQDPGGRRRT